MRTIKLIAGEHFISVIPSHLIYVNYKTIKKFCQRFCLEDLGLIGLWLKINYLFLLYKTYLILNVLFCLNREYKPSLIFL